LYIEALIGLVVFRHGNYLAFYGYWKAVMTNFRIILIFHSLHHKTAASKHEDVLIHGKKSSVIVLVHVLHNQQVLGLHRIREPGKGIFGCGDFKGHIAVLATRDNFSMYSCVNHNIALREVLVAQAGSQQSNGVFSYPS
jgi:hypothetical protein